MKISFKKMKYSFDHTEGEIIHHGQTLTPRMLRKTSRHSEMILQGNMD